MLFRSREFFLFFLIMGEIELSISELICEIKKDKEKFGLLLHRFQPLIRKYVRILYKDEEEDMYAEFTAALWEAVCNIVFYNDEGQVIKYLTTALRNKYFELYRKSRQYNDHTIEIEEQELEEKKRVDNIYDDMLINDELRRIGDKLEGKKKQIFALIFLKGYADRQVASELDISRQYVHRIKKLLIEMIKKEVLDMKDDEKYIRRG